MSFLKKLLPTLKVEIQNDHQAVEIIDNFSELYPQQKLVLEQQYYRLTEANRANEHLDTKALGLLQASGLILLLIGALEFPNLFLDNPSGWVLAGIAVGFASFAGMIGFSLYAWMPTINFLPGTDDWDEIYDAYVTVDLETSFDKILVDTMHALNKSLEVNKRKSRVITGSTFLFLAQVIGLLIVALTS